MKSGEIIISNIDPATINETFVDQAGHHTLGESIGVDVTQSVGEHDHGAFALPIGTKVFIKSEIPALQDDPLYDSVGMILSQSPQHVNVLTLAPKNGARWGVHNAYGDTYSEIPDALAAFDRLFDPNIEFGSIAVMSGATGNLLGASNDNPIGATGCNSHESSLLGSTLSSSQLLDKYDWKPQAIGANSDLLRRDNSGEIMHLLPGEQHAEQPDRASRDQLSMLDRIQRLTQPGSELYGYSETSVLRGIESAITGGKFIDKSGSITNVTAAIRSGAERLVY